MPLATHNGDLSSELVLDITLLDRIGGLILDYLEQVFNAHLCNVKIELTPDGRSTRRELSRS